MDKGESFLSISVPLSTCPQIRAVYVGLKGWGARSGFTYSYEYGCAIDDSNKTAWEQWLAEHPHVKPYANKGFEFYEKIDTILGSTAKAKGTRMFVPHQALPIPSQSTATETQASTAVDEDGSQVENGARSVTSEVSATLLSMLHLC